MTSEHFDEPRGRDIVARSWLAVGVHGVKGEEDFVVVGGRNARAKALVLAALMRFGATDTGPAHLLGNGPDNICNRAYMKRIRSNDRNLYLRWVGGMPGIGWRQSSALARG